MTLGFCVFCGQFKWLRRGKTSGICSECHHDPICLKLYNEVLQCQN